MSGDSGKSDDAFNDVEHLIQELNLDGVRYRDFSGRDQQPKLKLISNRLTRPQTEVAAPVTVDAPKAAERRETAAAAPVPATATESVLAVQARSELPAESLQATFSRLIARAPLPPARKLNINLKLSPREKEHGSTSVAPKESVALDSLFRKLTSGSDGARGNKRSG
jgi:hypothetical protein